MKRKSHRTGFKGKHVEITGEEILSGESYDLWIKEPLFWLTKSEELLLSASILLAYQKKIITERIIGNDVFSTVWLLSGYSLENLFKAISATKVTIEISGQLPDDLKGHNLLKLCNNAGLTTTQDQKQIFEFLTEHILAYGRYPTHLKATKLKSNMKIRANLDLFERVREIWNLGRIELDIK